MEVGTLGAESSWPQTANQRGAKPAYPMPGIPGALHIGSTEVEAVQGYGATQVSSRARRCASRPHGTFSFPDDLARDPPVTAAQRAPLSAGCTYIFLHTESRASEPLPDT